ncbi:MAG: hemolysin III family protein [Streptococcaceae bacterium]|jgi:hemolysin III|nr:hemolysin III family protein [Streptococcaceae bacterium]
MLESKAYKIVNEVFNAVTHGIGMILAIVGLVFLLIKSHNVVSTTAYALYGSTLILLFLCSTLFHSLIFTKAKTVFQIFDHSSIYLLIAGTYTPYCLISLKGWVGIALLITIWSLAILGVVYKSVFLPKLSKIPKISTIIYIIMGWLCILTVKPLLDALGWNGFLLLLIGGLCYTLGAVFYSMNKVPFMHVVWHLFVMAGAAFMYFSIYLTT